MVLFIFLESSTAFLPSRRLNSLEEDNKVEEDTKHLSTVCGNLAFFIALTGYSQITPIFVTRVSVPQPKLYQFASRISSSAKSVHWKL